MEPAPGPQFKSPDVKSKDRLGVTGLILFGWALIIVLRLADLQIFGHEKYVKAAEAQQEKSAPIEPVRGSIVDRNGNFLAISSPSRIVAVNPRQIQNIGFAAALLARVLKLDASKLESDLRSGGRFPAAPRLFHRGPADFRRSGRRAFGHEAELADRQQRQRT